MHEKGIDVTFIAGFRSADIVILKDELKAASDKLIIVHRRRHLRREGLHHRVSQAGDRGANIKEGKPQFDRSYRHRPGYHDEVPG